MGSGTNSVLSPQSFPSWYADTRTSADEEGDEVERDTITIRRATRRDIPSLLRLYGSFAAHDDDPDGLSPGAADAIFDRIDADQNQALLVAEQDLGSGSV